METIAAIATASGVGGIGIIRISGSKAKSIAKKITKKSISKPRVASIRNFYEFCDNKNYPKPKLIDFGILLYFSAPNSFTGEDIVEMHIHGSPIALSLLLQSCINAGAKLALAGEFTKRAFINDKIDLVQAEAVADLINASSKSAAIGAAASLKGEFSQKINSVSKNIIEIRSLIEVGLDFSDEDLQFIEKKQLIKKINLIEKELIQLSRQTNNGKILNEGIKVAIIGEVNVGKSSLLNALIGEEIVIVTDFPGTTRDAITQTLLIEGIPFHIIDTAGIRSTNNPVEKIGISRTKSAIISADLILHIKCFDREGKINEDIFTQQLINSALNKKKNENDNNRILEVINKCDLLNSQKNCQDKKLVISAKERIGLEQLKKKIITKSGFTQERQSEQSLFIARSRHLVAINKCLGHIQTAKNLAKYENEELIAEELRLAHLALQNITGKYAPDDLLGEIFSNFCIGK